jgi:hypothetical protein
MSFRHRSQALLDRTRTPAPAWEKWKKSCVELRGIKNRKVREFYETQVRPPGSVGDVRLGAYWVELFDR